MNALNASAVMPQFLLGACIDPRRVTSDIPQQDFLDGFMLPRGVCTLLSTAGGSGKTTSGLKLAIDLAARGRCELFGERHYIGPLRALVVLGEETADIVSRKLAHELPGGVQQFQEGVALGNLAVVSWLEYAMRQPTPEKLFDDKGALTDSGRQLWASVKQWRPDFVFFDTLSSLSDGDYLQDRVAYTTLRELNGLAAATGATVVMTAHLVKGGAGKVDEKATADDLISLSRGSAAMVNAARHAVVMIPAPSGAFPGLETQEGDDVWLAGVKSNVAPHLAGRTLPVIRSSARRTFSALSASGQAFSEMSADRDAAMVSDLEDYLFCLVKLAAESLQPFAERGAMSPASLYADLLAPALPAGATKRQVERATENLIRRELVKVARLTATGMPLLDVEGGPFADPDANLDPTTGKPPQFKKGAPDVGRLAERLGEELEQLRAGRGQKNQDRPF